MVDFRTRTITRRKKRKFILNKENYLSISCKKKNLNVFALKRYFKINETNKQKKIERRNPQLEKTSWLFLLQSLIEQLHGKISEEIKDWNNTMKQFHQSTFIQYFTQPQKNIHFCLSAPETFTKIKHMWAII